MTSDKHKLQCDTGLPSANNKTIACYMQCILSISQAVSIPFSLFDALTRSWPLPYSWLSCRFARESIECFVNGYGYCIILEALPKCPLHRSKTPYDVILEESLHMTMLMILLLASLIKTFPCVAAFMSSLTIVCVALDRFRCIVQSDRTQVGHNCD